MDIKRLIDWGEDAKWSWPVPDLWLGGRRYPATVSDGVGSARGEGTHRGVDVCYKRSKIGAEPEYEPGTNDGTKWYFAPAGTPILAARDGTVWSVSKTPRGWAVVLSHGKPWATFYQHLEVVDLPVHTNGRKADGSKTIIKQGQRLGVMGVDPMQGKNAFRHLHFEVWHSGNANAAVDPEIAMGRWRRSKWEQGQKDV